MKLPCPAYYLEPERNPALPCVTVRPCLVMSLLPSATPPSAIIRVHSLTSLGWVSKLVPYFTLRSDLGKAIEQAATLIKNLPALEENAAAAPIVAGVGSGADLSAPNPGITGASASGLSAGSSPSLLP